MPMESSSVASTVNDGGGRAVSVLSSSVANNIPVATTDQSAAAVSGHCSGDVSDSNNNNDSDNDSCSSYNSDHEYSTSGDDDVGGSELDESLTARCLFCDECVPLAAFVTHCRQRHTLDLPRLLATKCSGSGERHNGDAASCQHGQDSFCCYDNDDDDDSTDDDYAFIQLVNYVRTHRVASHELVELPAAEWRHQRYLKPVLADDMLLTLDWRDIASASATAATSSASATAVTVSDTSSVSATATTTTDTSSVSATAASTDTASASATKIAATNSASVTDLPSLLYNTTTTAAAAGDADDGGQKQLRQLQLLLKQREQQLQQLMKDANTMRAMVHRIIVDATPPPAAAAPAAPAGGGAAASLSSSSSSALYCSNNSDGDSAYFDTYSDSGIHREMVDDRVRTDTYRRAIECVESGGGQKEGEGEEAGVSCVHGRRVLDLGCGSGILALLCARAGAHTVLAVDASLEAHRLAADAVLENSQQEVVSVRHTRAECLQRCDSGCAAGFDVIVSEWMGYMLLFEGMLESVLWARDNLLAPGGRLMPDACALHVCAVSDEQQWHSSVDQWRRGVCDGIRLSCLARGALRTASVELVPPAACCSQSQPLLQLDLYRCSAAQLAFTAPLALTLTRNCRVTALTVYFDVTFGGQASVGFSTAPDRPATHWKQTVLYLSRPRHYRAGHVLRGSFSCRRSSGGDHRCLDIVLVLDGVRQQYAMF